MRSRAALAALPGVLALAAAHAEVDPQLCFACHGPNGNSVNAAVPALAGQPAQFIGTQLIMFREKRRTDPQMSPVAAPLTNPEILALGKFFAAQQRAAPAQKPSEAVIAAGRKLAEDYNCVVCHGPALHGQQHIPRLAGQQKEYLRTQLRGFKAGTRFDMDGNMTSAAQRLQPADIDVLADYISGLE
ncbi:MAG TPA: c-type cytochrome [Ramlibacter sp.]|uniref:c-type cytochrome n=1 Tax=Ramlibacter sp. TaxID=1917967 RepID=UPI002D7E4823|nr:c-type cytochrome [Ramlibacter sp.]HET8744484.1 c-type cytochrome [Ramlibacter sp.]